MSDYLHTPWKYFLNRETLEDWGIVEFEWTTNDNRLDMIPRFVSRRIRLFSIAVEKKMPDGRNVGKKSLIYYGIINRFLESEESLREKLVFFFKLREVLSRMPEYEGMCIYLSGSVANGTNLVGSDVDVSLFYKDDPHGQLKEKHRAAMNKKLKQIMIDNDQIVATASKATIGVFYLSGKCGKLPSIDIVFNKPNSLLWGNTLQVYFHINEIAYHFAVWMKIFVSQKEKLKSLFGSHAILIICIRYLEEIGVLPRLFLDYSHHTQGVANQMQSLSAILNSVRGSVPLKEMNLAEMAEGFSDWFGELDLDANCITLTSDDKTRQSAARAKNPGNDVTQWDGDYIVTVQDPYTKCNVTKKWVATEKKRNRPTSQEIKNAFKLPAYGEPLPKIRKE